MNFLKKTNLLKYKNAIVEPYKIDYKILPSFLREHVLEDYPASNVVLDANNEVEISKRSLYKVPKINSISFGKESLRWLGPKL